MRTRFTSGLEKSGARTSLQRDAQEAVPVGDLRHRDFFSRHRQGLASEPAANPMSHLQSLRVALISVVPRARARCKWQANRTRSELAQGTDLSPSVPERGAPGAQDDDAVRVLCQGCRASL